MHKLRKKIIFFSNIDITLDLFYCIHSINLKAAKKQQVSEMFRLSIGILSERVYTFVRLLHYYCNKQEPFG